MPICERDPWRDQYFENIPCPDNVLIATDDFDAWPWYPKHNWIYDKLRIAQSQGFNSGPHGVMPPAFPVFSKPITNLKGMGVGSRVVSSENEMLACSTPGHFWMPLLEGPHVSTDCAVVNGQVKWLRHATGVPGPEGTFKYWTLHADEMPDVATYLKAWVGKYMAAYTGMMNFETIGGKIIEAHLRFADQWCDLNGKGWIEAMVRLYADGVWDYDEQRRVGYSVPLFARHNSNFSHPPQDLQTRIRAMPQVSSLQITFYDKKDAGLHPMPPGGFRLGIVNAWDLQAGFTAVDELAKAFPTHSLLRA
ncbi:MAG: hypothetical protein K8F90_04615 [Hyphomicrobiales bacterium]|nr:hypothetical protein [Hyphomicrobiales bacterium]